METAAYAVPAGTIALAATPIGDVRDASYRLISALSSANVIAAEDTRRLRNLLSRLGITTDAKLLSLHDHNENDKAPELIALAENGQSVLVVSDAGMPTVSDPGFRLAALARQHGVSLTVIPGPSAPVTALALSGLPSDRFTFEGFLPRKSGDAKRLLETVKTLPHTLIFFESPRRLNAALRLMANELGGQRRAAVCRELTKTYEETITGTLEDLVEATHDDVLGEITVVVEGYRGQENPADYLEEVLLKVQAGQRMKEAVADVAKTYNLRKNDLYAAALAAMEEA